MTSPPTIRNSANSRVYDNRGLFASILLGICRGAENAAKKKQCEENAQDESKFLDPFNWSLHSPPPLILLILVIGTQRDASLATPFYGRS